MKFSLENSLKKPCFDAFSVGCDERVNTHKKKKNYFSSS